MIRDRGAINFGVVVPIVGRIMRVVVLRRERVVLDAARLAISAGIALVEH